MVEAPDLYRYGKGMPRISSKNQVTLPVSALADAGLRAGDEVRVDVMGDGEILVYRASLDRMEAAFGAMTGLWPPDFLERLDAEDEAHDRRP